MLVAAQRRHDDGRIVAGEPFADLVLPVAGIRRKAVDDAGVRKDGRDAVERPIALAGIEGDRHRVVDGREGGRVAHDLRRQAQAAERKDQQGNETGKA